jgi:hypothetical protein
MDPPYRRRPEIVQFPQSIPAPHTAQRRQRGAGETGPTLTVNRYRERLALRTKRSAPRSSGPRAIPSTTRQAVESDATSPKSGRWFLTAQVGEAVAARGEHHGALADDTAGLVSGAALAHRREPFRECLC